MKIQQIHNYYRTRGGEDAVVENEELLLEFYSNQVALYSVNNDSVGGSLGKVKTALTTHYSVASRSNVRAELLKERPKIVHVHNTFPLLTPSIYDACIEVGIPVIQTLHNYRTICPTSLLMHKGKPCERSLRETAYWAVPHRVYHNSFIGTAVLAYMIEYHKRKLTWLTKVDRFICLTEFSKRKFVEAGFPKDKIAVKPNFTSDPGHDTDSKRGACGVFVGRLSEEKGIDVLLKAWAGIDFLIKIIGEGDVDGPVGSSVELLGRISKEEVLNNIKSSQFIVVPSICYEGFPMAIVEAFACGTPVICSRLGSMAEIVEDGVNGLHFEAGNPADLAEKVQWMIANPKRARQMGENARQEYLAKYTPEKNYEMLMDIYQQGIEKAKKR